MTLVSVDSRQDAVQEVAVLLDPRDRSVENTPGSGFLTSKANPMFVDVYTQAYKSFGLDVCLALRLCNLC